METIGNKSVLLNDIYYVSLNTTRGKVNTIWIHSNEMDIKNNEDTYLYFYDLKYNYQLYYGKKIVKVGCKSREILQVEKLIPFTKIWKDTKMDINIKMIKENRELLLGYHPNR